MSKYLDKLRDAEDAIAGEIVEDIMAEFTAEEKQNAAILLGRAQAADRIAVALSAEVIRFLEHFEKTKAYRALGHRDFVTFIAKCGLYDVTKNRYYDRKKILDKEGDPVFNMLTVAGVPISVRGQLEAGDVTVEGDSIIVKGDDDSDDIVIHKDDHKAIVQALRNQATVRRTAAKEAAELREKLKKSEDQRSQEKREHYDEIDRIKASKASELDRDPHAKAVADVCFAFAALRDEIELLSVVDAEGRCTNTLETLAHQMALTSQAYGGSADWAAEVRTGNGSDRVSELPADEGDALDALLGDVDISENDAELADAM